jgi:uncharacterized UPF0146 family protein
MQHDVLVIVDVQLGIRVRGASGLERNSDKVLAEDVVEDAVAEGAVFVKDFVDDVLYQNMSFCPA